MQTLETLDVQSVAGGQPALSNVLAAAGLAIAICTAPAWGSAGAIIGMAVLFAKTLES